MLCAAVFILIILVLLLSKFNIFCKISIDSITHEVKNKVMQKQLVYSHIKFYKEKWLLNTKYCKKIK